jgi:hypothetical protein
MGGQNHQPTSSIRLIAPSAWLSQKVGEAFTEVLQSNSELENAIMIAVDRLHVECFASGLSKTADEYLQFAIKHLNTALSKVDDIQRGYKHLLDAAAQERYKGNPLASTVGGTLILPTVNERAWNDVQHRVKDTNILRTLEWESAEFNHVRIPTSDLIRVIEEARNILQLKGKEAFIEAIECNQISLRQCYARVFSSWNHLHAMFLYSALMMTELFYRTNRFGTLLQDSQRDRATDIQVA